MKQLLVFTMLSVILTAFGQDEPDALPAEQKAIKTACEIMKLYYPVGDICFSDSIYVQIGFSKER